MWWTKLWAHFYSSTTLSVSMKAVSYVCGFYWCVNVFFGFFQGHPSGKLKRSAFSLAAQFLLCQQPLLIPGLFLHCAVVYYAVLTATPPHPPAGSTALHPLLGAVVGRGPRLTHPPYQPLNFVERKVWTACLIFQSQSLLLFFLKLSAYSASPESKAAPCCVSRDGTEIS